jgi:hypothetical protein
MGGIYEVRHRDGLSRRDRTKFQEDVFSHSEVDKGDAQRGWRLHKSPFMSSK